MKILIVDDESLIAEAVRMTLKLSGYKDVTICSEATAGETEIKKNIYDIVFLDIMMPGKRGDQILESVKNLRLNSVFIVISAVNEMSTVVKCIKSGAFDYILKPFDNELLLSVIQKVIEADLLKKSLKLFSSSEGLEKPEEFGDFLTNDSNMIKLLNYISNIGNVERPIMFTGETGCGKTMFAKIVHNVSPRKNYEFVAVNINSIPSQLFESSMFGYVKGAFTGALKDTPGFASRADKGSLFLDEIGDLDLFCQAKLLNMIEEKKYFRLGTNKEEYSDFRLITATNKNLRDEVKNGRFREDLYYRICSNEIRIPPLRERGNDIIYIANILLDRLNRDYSSKKEFAPETCFKLLNYSMPGNFRELKNIVEKSYYSVSDEIIMPENIVLPYHQQNELNENIECGILSCEENKKKHIISVLSSASSKKQAAEILGISRTLLYKYIKKYGL
ncbi:MAG TPA: sigma-54 dependent transcriptional regulator [bacterium]|nr:sigma-54 dependent transcriptional regulator [bacterium]